MGRHLEEILPEKTGYKIIGKRDVEVGDIHLDSRLIEKNGLFAAVKGTHSDGHDFIEMAIENGATSFLVEQLPDDYSEGFTWILTKNVKQAVAEMADKFFENPSNNLTVIAVTGTNGKTSVAWMIYQSLLHLGEKAGLISTIDIRIGDEIEKSKLTTPDVVSVHRLFARMVDHQCTCAVMEASSHALDQGRLDQVEVDIAIFTNLTRDHLDYHGDMLSYINSKKILFDRLSTKSSAIINKDDKNGAVMIQNSKADIKYYALQNMADYKFRLKSMDLNGMDLEVDRKSFLTQITGRFNAYNLAATFGSLIEMNFESEEVLRVLSMISGPEGRLDVLRDENGRPRAIVDYAHTPDAVKSLLEAVNVMKNRDQEVVIVLGAGGDRDRGKRPLMAQVAYRGASRVILTSDNPRNESAGSIINDMLDGLNDNEKSQVLVIESRREAIKTACILANKNDIVLVVGKGHEKYQEMNGERIPFDDKVEVYNFILYKES